MKKIDKIVIEGTTDDMNNSFEEFLKQSIPNKAELENFKKSKEALLMLYGAFQQGWKLGLRFALDSIKKYELYENIEPLSDNLSK